MVSEHPCPLRDTDTSFEVFSVAKLPFYFDTAKKVSTFDNNIYNLTRYDDDFDNLFAIYPLCCIFMA